MTDGTLAMHADERPAVVFKIWPRSVRSVPRARRLLTQHLDVWGLPHLSESAELVVSELVTNAVNHARSPRGHLIGTRFERLENGGVRIEVHDACEGKPERREASADAEFGRGLALVDALTGGRWGVSLREGPGKVVWAVCTNDEMGGSPVMPESDDVPFPSMPDSATPQHGAQCLKCGADLMVCTRCESHNGS